MNEVLLEIRKPQMTPMGRRLELALDKEVQRMRNEWFFKWHFIGKDGPVEIDGFDGRNIHYGGIAYSGSAVLVYWDTISRYLRQKLRAEFDAAERELQSYPLDIREKFIGELTWLINGFSARIRQTAIEKDSVLRNNGAGPAAPVDQGNWRGSLPQDVDEAANALRYIYCNPTMIIEGVEMSLRGMMKDSATFVKKDGQVVRENFSALVTPNQVTTFVTDLAFEVGDHILRNLPNQMVEDYIIERPDYHSELASIPANFQLKVRRSGVPTAPSHTIIANLNGGNARMYVNSTDNSVNAVGVSVADLAQLVKQIRLNKGALPEIVRREIESPLSDLEAEAASPAPSQAKISSALASIKDTCVGVAGNLVAAGILALIDALF